MDADGTKPVRLTASPDTDVDSDWQPLTDATTALAAKPSQSPLERQMERIAGRAIAIRIEERATLYALPPGEVEQAVDALRRERRPAIDRVGPSRRARTPGPTFRGGPASTPTRTS